MNTMAEARLLNEKARSVFEHDKSHVPMALFIKGGKVMGVLPIEKFLRNDQTKDILEHLICELLRTTSATGMAMIAEAWTRRIAMSDKKAMQDAKKHGIADASDKLECLMVIVESDDGLAVTFCNPITRDVDGVPTLGKADEVIDGKGRFSQFFQKSSEPMPFENSPAEVGMN